MARPEACTRGPLGVSVQCLGSICTGIHWLLAQIFGGPRGLRVWMPRDPEVSGSEPMAHEAKGFMCLRVLGADAAAPVFAMFGVGARMFVEDRA